MAIDAKGNVSKPATVKVNIQKQSTTVSYSDLGTSSMADSISAAWVLVRGWDSWELLDSTDTATRRAPLPARSF